ncbi:MAG: TonB-dependent siderophore receptor [Pseudomonas sp.]|uniref:TonB-dependent siderophore receptor n=1 Tax=Pseudomonas sp. TaxID=306 RepID=UPI003397EE79
MRKPWPRALALAIALASTLPLGVAHGDTPAEQQVLPFDLPAASLGETLNAIARQSGQLVALQPALVEGKQAAAIRGNLTATQALQRALDGSGLELRVTASGSFSVQPAADTSGALQLGPARAYASGVNATSEGSGSYAPRAISIGKGDRALKDIPQSITVMTRQQLDDQGITDLHDAANQITGLVGVKGVGQGMVLSARGFQIDDWQYDGVPVPRNVYSLGNWGTEGLVFYDRLEVLRGAAGLLQGTGSPGGAVNLVRKRGQDTPTLALTGKAGSWDHYGLQLDAGGPLNAEGSVRGRVLVDEDQSQSFTDYVRGDTTSLYAALDIDLAPDTTLGLGVSHSDSESRPMVRGLPRYPDGSDIGLPRSTYVGADWNQAEIEQTSLYADLEHRFNPDWSLKTSALHMSERNRSTHQRMHGDVAADGSGLTFADWITDFDAERIGLDSFLNGRFQALSLEHELTLGGNYSQYRTDDLYARRFSTGGNIFAIDHHRPQPDLDSILASPGGRVSYSDYDIRQKGLYASLRTQLTQPLTLILGSRVSWYDYLYSSGGVDSPNTATGEVTPYLGLVYALTKEWSAYASYTDVFEPQSQRTTGGSVLEPIIGSNYEVGLKGELLDGQLNTSFALFRYDQENRAVTDYDGGFACDDWYCSRASGRVRSQGFEAEASGEVLPGLQLAAGYTFNTTKFLDDPDNQGKVFSQWTPKHMLRVWSQYQLPGEWDRLSVGLGFNAQSHTLGYNREYEVAGFSVWNARLGYQLTPELALGLNLNNLLDKRYYIPAFNETNGNNEYGDPRNFMLTARYTPQF